MKNFMDLWHHFLLNDKAMVIFALWTIAMLAFWHVANPENIVTNITSGLLGMVVGSGMTKAADPPK